MQINWIATNKIYHQIIGAETLTEKEDIYRNKIMQPWQTMMQMVSRTQSDDEFAGACAWGWHTPEDLNHIPDTLAQLESANAWQIGEEALIKGVEAFENHTLPMDTAEGWLMLGIPERMPMQQGDGYTGAIDFTYPRFVCQYFQPNKRNIQSLSGAVVHEFNHLIRLRVQPWDMVNTNVGDYIIHEGIAESFATALFGEEVLGYYAADISDADLAIAHNLIADNLQTTGFDVIRGYIFGDSMADTWGFQKIGMPDFGGYAVGYRVVQAFLRKTGTSIQDTTYLPAEQIIAESGYFG